MEKQEKMQVTFGINGDYSELELHRIFEAMGKAMIKEQDAIDEENSQFEQHILSSNTITDVFGL